MYASYVMQSNYLRKQMETMHSLLTSTQVTSKVERMMPPFLMEDAKKQREEITQSPTYTKFIRAEQNQPFRQNLEDLNSQTLQLIPSAMQIMQPVIRQAALNAVAKVVGQLAPQISQHVTAALQQPTPAPLQNFTQLVPKPAPVPSSPAENTANYVNYILNLASIRNAPILTPLATKGQYDDVCEKLHNGMEDIHAMFMKPLGNPDFLVFTNLFRETIHQIRNDLLLNYIGTLGLAVQLGYPNLYQHPLAPAPAPSPFAPEQKSSLKVEDVPEKNPENPAKGVTISDLDPSPAPIRQ
jgi:hypothetical protein